LENRIAAEQYIITMKMTKKQSWIPAGVYPCENRDGNDRGRLFRFLLLWG